ncbi:MAG TPA: hypothetical protein VMU22_02735 [Rhizomicrobium sp.]|nr:hypothetical protein [Rhizomicrobium sp.]
MPHEFHLSPPGKGRGISCDAEGAFIGAIPILKRLQMSGRDEWQPRDCDELSEEIGEHYGLPIDMSSKTGGLKAIAKALNAGNIARAQIATVLLGIPDPPPLSKGLRSREQMIRLVRDLHWSGMIKWDPDKHPRWPAGSADSAGGEFAPEGQGGVTDSLPTSQSDAVDRTRSHSPEHASAARSPRIQLANNARSDASDDPVAEAAARAAAAARSNAGAAHSQPKPRDGEQQNFWQAFGAHIPHEVKSAFEQVARMEVAESNNDLMAATAETQAIAHVLRAYNNYRAQPWFKPNGYRMQVPVGPALDETSDPLVDSSAWSDALAASARPMRPATNGDWIDPLVNLLSAGAMGAGMIPKLVGPAADALAPLAAPAESELLIGNSGFRSIDEFTDAVTEKYQALYDQHYAGTMDLVSRDLIPNDPLIIGRRTDALARVDLRDWLANEEGINEGTGQIIQINRRLYDPSGSGNYRVPDVYIPRSKTILDGSLQFKTGSMSQVTDYQAFSGGANVIVIRPATAPSDVIAGSYGIVR